MMQFSKVKALTTIPGLSTQYTLPVLLVPSALCVTSCLTLTMTWWGGDCRSCCWYPHPFEQVGTPTSQLLWRRAAKGLQLSLLSRDLPSHLTGAALGGYLANQPWVTFGSQWLRDTGHKNLVPCLRVELTLWSNSLAPCGSILQVVIKQTREECTACPRSPGRSSPEARGSWQPIIRLLFIFKKKQTTRRSWGCLQMPHLRAEHLLLYRIRDDWLVRKQVRWKHLGRREGTHPGHISAKGWGCTRDQHPGLQKLT